MNSLEHAKAAAEEMDMTDNPYSIAIIQKAMDAYAKEVLAEDTKSKGTLIVENHRLKKANRELLKDKERVMEVIKNVLHTNGGPIEANETIDECEYVMVNRNAFNELEALDKAALRHCSHNRRQPNLTHATRRNVD
jgi:hypothetical protein